MSIPHIQPLALYRANDFGFVFAFTNADDEQPIDVGSVWEKVQLRIFLAGEEDEPLIDLTTDDGLSLSDGNQVSGALSSEQTKSFRGQVPYFELRVHLGAGRELTWWTGPLMVADAPGAAPQSPGAYELLIEQTELVVEIHAHPETGLALQAQVAAEAARDQAQSVVDNAIGDMEAARDQALGQINNAHTDALSEITDARTAALAQIDDESTSALAQIDNAHTDALLQIDGARDTALTAVGTARSDAEQAIQTAHNDGVQAIQDAQATGVGAVQAAQTTGVGAIEDAQSAALSALATARDDALSQFSAILAQAESARDAAQAAEAAASASAGAAGTSASQASDSAQSAAGSAQSAAEAEDEATAQAVLAEEYAVLIINSLTDLGLVAQAHLDYVTATAEDPDLEIVDPYKTLLLFKAITS